MIRTVAPEITRFAALVREITGNVVPQARYGFLEELLRRRARASEQPDVTSYVHRLAVGELAPEWQQLIPLITIKESYFFRAPQQFHRLAEVILPRLMRACSAERTLRIWSAACARGEEPATLAMVLADTQLLGGWDWHVVATDVDDEALAVAERGIYGDRAVSRVPPRMLERYFQRRGKLFELVPSVRARIRYRKLNLAHPPYDLPEKTFDLVFLRNVLIYFPRPLQRRVVTYASKHLASRGYLFLGASETLWQIHEDLDPLDLDVCFCYRHPRPGQKPKPPPRRPVQPRPAPPKAASLKPAPPKPPPSAPLAPAVARVEEDPGPVSAIPEPAESPGGAAVEALPALDPPLAPSSVQERLSEAARELAENRIDEARRVLEGVLAADPSEPAAHALEGFLFDLQADPDEAVSSYRAALYLDPSLYQARLLLADCLHRLGHRERAHHQYREVLAYLSGGRERELLALEELPLPTRQRAERRCRQVLRGG